MKSSFSFLTVLAVCLGCNSTNQDSISLPLFVTGTNSTEPVMAQNNTQIVIDRADLAFGPLYLCAGVNAGDLCSVARLEWLDTVVVNTLDSQPQQAGELTGVTGQVLSWMYDLGISSQLTRDDPYILTAAEKLGGFSLVLEGRAVVDEIELPFTASMQLQQTDDTELGVPIIRKSLSDPFNRDVTLKDKDLTIKFNPADWVSELDFSRYVSRGECSVDAPEVICNGTQELNCDGEQIISQRDCGDLEQVCLPQKGCTDSLVIEPESELYRALRNSIFSGVRPSFFWNTPKSF
jgi:hypothetical protein